MRHLTNTGWPTAEEEERGGLFTERGAQKKDMNIKLCVCVDLFWTCAQLANPDPVCICVCTTSEKGMAEKKPD